MTKVADYSSSIILGMSDAIVEILGTLVGFTFAFQQNKLVILAVLITGITASFSMASSEYLESQDEGQQNSLFRGICTGLSYMGTLLLLLLPYFFVSNFLVSFLITFVISLAVILLFSLYICKVKKIDFHKKFTEMLLVVLSVALINFGIGFVIRKLIPLPNF